MTLDELAPNIGMPTFSNLGLSSNIEIIKNILIVETDYAKVQKYMDAFNLSWSTPVDSVNNTPIHILVNAEYMNLPLFLNLPDKVVVDHFYSALNALNLNSFSILVANWRYVPADQTELYQRALLRAVLLSPPGLLAPNNLVVHLCIQTLNIAFFDIIRTHPNYPTWVNVKVGGELSVRDHLRKQIVAIGINDQTRDPFHHLLTSLTSPPT